MRMRSKAAVCDKHSEKATGEVSYEIALATKLPDYFCLAPDNSTCLSLRGSLNSRSPQGKQVLRGAIGVQLANSHIGQTLTGKSDL